MSFQVNMEVRQEEMGFLSVSDNLAVGNRLTAKIEIILLKLAGFEPVLWFI